jgi:hypothetical protein
VEHGGGTFFTDTERMRRPVWLPLISSPPRPRSQQAALDLILFDCLLNIFLERLNFLEPVSGRSALHLAFWNSNLGATRFLLDRVKRDLDVNLEAIKPAEQPSGSKCFEGWTALDMVIFRRRGGKMPQFIIDRGTRYVKRWRQDLKAITRLLLEAGAQSGSGGGTSQKEKVSYELESNDPEICPWLFIGHYVKHQHCVLELANRRRDNRRQIRKG